MRARAHLRLLALALAVWAAFFAAGLPDYYRQYPLSAMLAFCAAVTVGVVAAAFRMLRGVRPERRIVSGAWFAFYFTVPLAALDYLYCGLHLGYGWGFLGTYWYLTAFYVIPWLVFVPVAYRLDSAGERASSPRSLSSR
jgi:hypothetical protein